jgi:hypothetical protein
MKSLTKAEEQVMQALWKVEKAFLRQIVDAMPCTETSSKHGGHSSKNPDGKRICERDRFRTPS